MYVDERFYNRDGSRKDTDYELICNLMDKYQYW